MKYRLKIGSRITELEGDLPAGQVGRARLSVAKRSYEVLYRVVSPSCYHLVVNGGTHLAFVARAQDGKHVSICGRCFHIEEVTQHLLRPQKATAPERTPETVTPPMPSVVVRILVREGELVERGQGLVVVSAMKMETTLVAPYAGVVRRINTKVDAKVAPGDVLVEIEKGGDERG